MNAPANKAERDLSELKLRYQVICYVAVFGCITAGFLLGMLLLLGIAMMFGLDVHQPVGQQRFGVLFVFGLLAAGSAGAYLGMKVTDRMLAFIFALFGQNGRISARQSESSIFPGNG